MKSKGFVGIFFLILIGFVVIGGFGLVWRFVMLPARAIDRSIGTAEGVIDKTLTADNAIYNYEWFKQQVEDIKANQKKIDAALQSTVNFLSIAGSHDTWTFEDKTEYARLSSIQQGLESQQANLVADYNARAKMANRNIFQDGKIPDFIELGSRFLK